MRLRNSVINRATTFTVVATACVAGGCRSEERTSNAQAPVVQRVARLNATDQDCAKLLLPNGLHDTSNKKLLQTLGQSELEASLTLAQLRTLMVGAKGGDFKDLVKVCQSVVAGKTDEANRIALKVVYDVYRSELGVRSADEEKLTRDIGGAADKLQRDLGTLH